ncbi:MAG TPA: DUF167 domain-containing protein [Rhizobiales bacterium]|nr:DUF167 domain-containing protein [Hyphomicrobiales bacterium]
MADTLWQKSKHGLTIRLRVTPKASKNAITGVYTDANGVMSLKVSTTAQPEKGKANKAVIAILSKKFGKAKSFFKVISGETDRNKTILLDGSIEEIKQWLLPALKEIEHG